MAESQLSVDELIQQLPQLADRPELIDPLKNVFQFTQFLLDDDENLTRTGNLNADAKRKLQSRIREVFDMNAESDAESAEELAVSNAETHDSDEGAQG